MQKLSIDVWSHIEDELHRRRLNAAWLSRELSASRQVVSGWKRRGVPSARYEQIAQLFGWTVDRLITGMIDVASLQTAHPPEVFSVMAVAQPSAQATYSPMALDLARRLDDIADDHKKCRAYALVLQLLTMVDVPSSTVPTP